MTQVIPVGKWSDLLLQSQEMWDQENMGSKGDQAGFQRKGERRGWPTHTQLLLRNPPIG